MQQNVKMQELKKQLEQVFPEAKGQIHASNSVKISVKAISSGQLLLLGNMIRDRYELSIRRSGTKVTIIIWETVDYVNHDTTEPQVYFLAGEQITQEDMENGGEIAISDEDWKERASEQMNLTEFVRKFNNEEISTHCDYIRIIWN